MMMRSVSFKKFQPKALLPFVFTGMIFSINVFLFMPGTARTQPTEAPTYSGEV